MLSDVDNIILPPQFLITFQDLFLLQESLAPQLVTIQIHPKICSTLILLETHMEIHFVQEQTEDKKLASLK